MDHPLHRVISFDRLGEYTLRVWFDDGTDQVIDFRPLLSGELFGPLRDPFVFDKVQIDPEAHTLVWPTGADLDPATLHDWPDRAAALTALARRWELMDRTSP
jgi:hypothetical protein